MKKKAVLFILFFSVCMVYGQEGIKDIKSEKYELKYIEVKKFIDALPEELKKQKINILTDINGFIIRCTQEEQKIVEEYIKILDIEKEERAILLKYISSEELLKHLPPAVNKESIVVTGNPNLIFFRGSNIKREKFLKEMELIDRPKAQIRYQLLVVQYEKSENINWAKSLEVKKTKGKPMSEFSGIMSNIFNINFDIVSKFGYQFIAKLNFELAENKARVLADTTLNGITGEEVKFQNTNTFRYIDKTLDSNGKPLYGSVREITSGLLLNIKGNVSGDGMITMEVNAQVSKQGSGGVTSGVLPPTSEKIVRTKVRTPSGKPIIIGGLLQVEQNSSEKKIPGLGDIPIAGLAFKDINGSETVTEMVIYIVPYIHREREKVKSKKERLIRLYKKYIEGEDKE
ncbi:type II and III secretion system protein [Treponema sp. OMZ 792]|uniref:type II secretion system protein GspD n=1 Tax=unclassified Treponema TaxID=2638727 RepID=UPI0020A3B14C|nr:MULTISPECIES: type II and III secretion system protein [unclassified Treponema]UTC75802.1 type II and III secretion system protein [Treponema sp. OMZ 792]UTC79802.1 type II and III secretion system protein [Treponema sp. OMZ 798]